MLTDQKPGPAKIVALAYELADLIKVTDKAAERLWRFLPAERRAAFAACEDLDTYSAERAIRAAADAWQAELDREPE